MHGVGVKDPDVRVGVKDSDVRDRHENLCLKLRGVGCGLCTREYLTKGLHTQRTRVVSYAETSALHILRRSSSRRLQPPPLSLHQWYLFESFEATGDIDADEFIGSVLCCCFLKSERTKRQNWGIAGEWGGGGKGSPHIQGGKSRERRDVFRHRSRSIAS